MLSHQNKHYNESEAHESLKQEAVILLREEGYIAFQEYWVSIGNRKFRVDVVGFKHGESIAIECGRTPYRKMEQLKYAFTEVKRILYSRWLHPKAKFKLKQETMKEVVRSHIVPAEVIGVAKIHGKGKVQIPQEVRDILNLKDGDKIYFIENEDGRIILEKAPTLKRERFGKYVVTERR